MPVIPKKTNLFYTFVNTEKKKAKRLRLETKEELWKVSISLAHPVGVILVEGTVLALKVNFDLEVQISVVPGVLLQ